MISPAQRKMMGAFSRREGDEAVHQVLKEVTVNKITSFRDPALTSSMMIDVISEFILRFPETWRDIQSRRRPGRGEVTETIEVINRAISPDKQRAIWKLRNILKMNDAFYREVCRRSLGVEGPGNEAQALTIIGVLNRIVRKRREGNNV